MKKVLKQVMAVLLVFSMLISIAFIPEQANAASKLALSASKITIKVGETKKVTLNNAPKEAEITWSSKSTKIAKVNNGQITGVTKGSTTVTCKVVYTDNKKKVTKKLKLEVTVKSDDSTIAKDVSNISSSHLSANGITTKDNGQMRTELTSTDMMKYMGQGWNLGNTLETSSISKGQSLDFYEASAGSVKTTQKIIDGIKKYGFNTVRIPVAWSNMISDDGKYTIDEALLDRVETVMNYALNDEMYVIINIHFDGGWWGQFGSPDEKIRENAWKRYESFWTQISNRYKEYSDRLILESGNEEIGDRLNEEINGVEGVLTEDEQYEMSKKINQKFVDIVRESGGNNESRQLLIAGFNTDIDKTNDSRFVMPKDISKNGTSKLSISVHYYTPSTFCIVNSDQGWGFSDTWGTKADIKELHDKFDMMTKFTDAGYGVVIGEYGVCSPNKNGVATFLNEVATYGAKLGFCPVLWEANCWYDRSTYQFTYNDVAKVYIDATGSSAKLIDGAPNTGLKDITIVDESKLKLMYTWEGTFVKNDGSNKSQSYKQTSCSDGLTVFNNSWCYYLYLTADWASMKQPCIKVYVKDDPQSKNASLELYNVDEKDGVMDNGNDMWYNAVTYQAADGWTFHCIQLDKEKLLNYDALCLTGGNGIVITKIEIYDLK